jgi:5-methylcytosine-specific restriction endonuclease McrA
VSAPVAQVKCVAAYSPHPWFQHPGPPVRARVSPVAVRQTRRARAQRRRARRVAAAGNDLTNEEWAELEQRWGCCAYCGATDAHLQRDCVLPISRGGRYTLDNVAPACRTCNASKGNHEVTAWMRRRRLDERAFLTRWVDVLAELRVAERDQTGGTGFTGNRTQSASASPPTQPSAAEPSPR